jgi:hypothetical protein
MNGCCPNIKELRAWRERMRTGQDGRYADPLSAIVSIAMFS